MTKPRVLVQYRLWWSLREERPLLVQVSVSALSLVLLTMPLVVGMEEMLHWGMEQGRRGKQGTVTPRVPAASPLRPGLPPEHMDMDDEANQKAGGLRSV